MSTPRRVGQAVRQILFATLTSPPLVYKQDTGSGYSDITLPSTSVVPRAIWNLVDNVPSTYVCFAIKGRGATSRAVADRRMVATFWIVGQDEDECEEIYEAIRARVHTGDQDPGFFATDLSRAGDVADLGAAIIECVEQTAYPCDFDKTTARWMKVVTFSMVAS
jgi:hypothetical protein